MSPETVTAIQEALVPLKSLGADYFALAVKQSLFWGHVDLTLAAVLTIAFVAVLVLLWRIVAADGWYEEATMCLLAALIIAAFLVPLAVSGAARLYNPQYTAAQDIMRAVNGD